MKNFNSLLLFFIVCCFSANITPTFAQNQKVEFENVKEKCKGKPFDQRVRVSVARFNVTNPNAKRRGGFGDELATMLSNALSEVNCFRVLQSIKNKADMTDELNFGQEGFTANGSSPESGKMLGAQAVITGEVTEFYEGEGRAGAFGISVTKNTARIGFIIQVINPQTREILWSQSVEAQGKKPGKFGGVKLFGINIAGSSMQNTAIGDAVERGIIKTAVLLAEERETIPFPAVNSGVTASKNWNSTNCPVLSAGNSPSIMVLLSEKHINYYLPNPNSESAIVSKFVNAGFTVIDPSMYAAMRKEARFEQALKNPTAAASLGSDFGADVVIIGEGVSQVAKRDGINYSCRASVTVKAIRVDNSQIIASVDTQAGAQDITETTASNRSLKNAGDQIASKMLEQFCTRGMGKGMTNNGMAGLNTTKIKINNTDFMKMRKLSTSLAKSSQIKKAENTGFDKNKGELTIQHEGSSDELMGIIADQFSSICDITGYDPSSKEIEVKMK